MRSASSSSPAIATAPEPVVKRTIDLPVSDGAIRAFKKELESPGRMTVEPGSLAGAVLDLSPSSRSLLAGPPSSAASPTAPTSSSTALAPPRKAGSRVVTVLAVLAIAAALVALGRFLVQ